jgi:ArsR family transcriptional regulator
MARQPSENRRSATRTPRAAARIESMFRAFADRTRLRILRLLQGGPLCVGDLVEILRAPQPTVSRHLAYLRRSGFVGTRQNGLWMFYELAPAQNAVHGKLLGCLAACDALLAEAKVDQARARSVRRSGGCCPDGRRFMEQLRERNVDEK